MIPFIGRSAGTVTAADAVDDDDDTVVDIDVDVDVDTAVDVDADTVVVHPYTPAKYHSVK